MAIHEYDIGDRVNCDWCNADYTDSDEGGGLLFDSKATCPRCAFRIRIGAEEHGETDHIRAECPIGMSFRQFVLDICCGGDNRIRVLTGEDAEQAMFGQED